MVKKEIPLKVAVAQYDITFGAPERNLAASLSYINQAADNGAQLIILPELCISGYVFANRAEAFALSESIPDGPACAAWAQLARERQVYIAGGINENAGDRLYNSSVLIGPEGFIGKYRKLQLWEDEYLWFEPGDRGLPVFSTPLGRIGLLICNDLWYPELYRILAVQGADIICGSVDPPLRQGLPYDVSSFYPLHCLAAANCNNVYVAAAGRIGEERGCQFAGGSLIAAPGGGLLAGPAGPAQETVLYGQCDLALARRHQANAYNSVLCDRRADVYDRLLGYRPEKYGE